MPNVTPHLSDCLCSDCLIDAYASSSDRSTKRAAQHEQNARNVLREIEALYRDTAVPRSL